MRTYAYFAFAAIAGGFSISGAAFERIDKMPVTLPPPPPPPMFEAMQKIDPPEAGKPSPPIPSENPGRWANTADYPAQALSEQREGRTSFKLSIDATGKVIACEITQSSGYADLDEATCKNVYKRGRFYPAQDDKGRAIAGQWSSAVKWVIPEVFSMVMPSQVNLSSPRPPQLMKWWNVKIVKDDYPPVALAAGEQGVVQFAVDTDKTGKAIGCAVTKSSGSSSLDEKSCDLAKSWEYEPARNLQGEPTLGKAVNSINWRLPKGSFPKKPMESSRLNPFGSPGAVKITMDFDKVGKVTDCSVETKGRVPFAKDNDTGPQNLCETAPIQGITPFTDAEGNTVSRRVIITMSIEHADIDAVTPPTKE